MIINPIEKEYLSWDAMGGANSAAVGTSLYSVLDAIQTKDREVQILGVAALFLLMCQQWNVEPASVLRITDNILTKNQEMPQFQAAAEYIRQEL